MKKIESPDQVADVFLKAIHDNFGTEFSAEQLNLMRLGSGLFLTSLMRVRASETKSLPEKIGFQLEVLDTIMRLTRSLDDQLQCINKEMEVAGDHEKV